jgi:hypothetical protein
MKLANGSIGFVSSTFCDRNKLRITGFSLAIGIKKAQPRCMTTVTKLATVAMSIAICASAFAAPSKSVATSKQQTIKAKRCVAIITGSAVRQDCARLGVIPTTAYQLDRIGGHSATND